MIEYFVAPRPGGKQLKLLFCDAMKERTDSIRVIGGNHTAGYHVKVSRTLETIREDLKKPWDLVFHSAYLGSWNESHDESVELLKDAFKAGRIKGVICTSILALEARKMLGPLIAAGVPVRYIPYDYEKPSRHKEVPLAELFKEEKK